MKKLDRRTRANRRLVPPVGQGWGRLGSHRTIGLLGNWRGDVTRPQRPGAGTPPRPVPAPKPAPNSRTPSPRSMPLIRAATVRPPFSRTAGAGTPAQSQTHCPPVAPRRLTRLCVRRFVSRTTDSRPPTRFLFCPSPAARGRASAVCRRANQPPETAKGLGDLNFRPEL